jgi:hypothetical protein
MRHSAHGDREHDPIPIWQDSVVSPDAQGLPQDLRKHEQTKRLGMMPRPSCASTGLWNGHGLINSIRYRHDVVITPNTYLCAEAKL